MRVSLLAARSFSRNSRVLLESDAGRRLSTKYQAPAPSTSKTDRTIVVRRFIPETCRNRESLIVVQASRLHCMGRRASRLRHGLPGLAGPANEQHEHAEVG